MTNVFTSTTEDPLLFVLYSFYNTSTPIYEQQFCSTYNYRLNQNNVFISNALVLDDNNNCLVISTSIIRAHIFV